MLDSGPVTVPNGLSGGFSPQSSLLLGSLRPGECFRVQGTGSQYFFLVVDPGTSLVVCQGGTKPIFRTEPRLAHLDGAGQSMRIHHPGEVRSYYGMVLRLPGDTAPRFTSSTVPERGIERLRVIPERHEAFVAIAHSYWSEAVLRDPEFVVAWRDFFDRVPVALHDRARQSLEFFAPRARVLLLSVFGYAYQNGSLARTLDLFGHQQVRHWSRALSEVRGEPKTETDLRYWRELCMMARFPPPAVLRSVQSTAT